jgi:hypothetical protein
MRRERRHGEEDSRMLRAKGGHAHDRYNDHDDERFDEDDIKELKEKLKHKKRMHNSEGGENWIAGAIKHPGALHEALGVSEGKNIPAKKLSKAMRSEDPTLRKEANLAKTLKSFHHRRP